MPSASTSTPNSSALLRFSPLALTRSHIRIRALRRLCPIVAGESYPIFGSRVHNPALLRYYTLWRGERGIYLIRGCVSQSFAAAREANVTQGRRDTRYTRKTRDMATREYRVIMAYSVACVSPPLSSPRETIGQRSLLTPAC